MKGATFSVTSSRKMEFLDLTGEVNRQLAEAGIQDGICILYNPHTTSGLTINEGADPAVQADIIAAFRWMVPLDYSFKHLEGNSPAHIMTSMVGSSVTMPVLGGKLSLGTWQRVFLCEFDGPRTRKVRWQVLTSS